MKNKKMNKIGARVYVYICEIKLTTNKATLSMQ